MSSVQSYIKQQNILYAPMPGISTVCLNYFVRNPYAASDPGSTVGTFYQSTIPVLYAAPGGCSSISVFRDMGQPIVSAGRTFRRIQQLVPAPPAPLTADGNDATSSQATQPNTFGVVGAPSTNAVVSDYNTWYYENSILSGGTYFTNQLYRIQ